MSDTRQEFLHNSGANIFYFEYFPADPQAPTLILLHGNGEDHTYFVKQIPAFSPHFRLVLMDTRGQGQSTGGDGELNFSVFAADLLALMDHLQIAKAHLLGFSDGGNLALTFALAHPERVQSLILNGANLEPGGVKLSTQLPIVLGYGCCRLLSPFLAQGPAKRRGAGADGQPSAHPAAGACRPDHAGTGDCRRTGHDPRPPQPAHRTLAAKRAVCAHPRRRPFLRSQVSGGL